MTIPVNHSNFAAMKINTKGILITAWVLVFSNMFVYAQHQNDSIPQEVKSYVARNFSEIRTFNLTWKTEPSHSYSIKSHGNKIAEGKLRSLNNIKFDANVPIMKTNNLTVYAMGEADFYNHHIENVKSESTILSQQENENWQYYRGGLNIIYNNILLEKPFILNTNISLDGYNHGLQQVLVSVTALSILHRSKSTNLSAGLVFVFPFYKIPVLPVITYWHSFSPRWSLDVTMPKQFYFRYQATSNNRLSLGTSLDIDQYYFCPENKNLPRTCYYSSASLNTEFIYEYITSHNFYFYIKGGLTKSVSGGIYKTNRKDIEGQCLKFTDSCKPFLSLGFSYNLFH